MAQTVIGFFEDAAAAQQALQRLDRMGIPRHLVDVSSSGAVDARGASRGQGHAHEEERGNGIRQFFNSLFGNNSSEADRYAHVGSSGCSIVTVQVPSREQAERVADVLDACGAIDVDERASQLEQASSPNTGSGTPENVRTTQEQARPRIQQDLAVGKRTVEQGGVRVRSRIVERPVEETVRLREEHVHVERQPVDRPVSETELRLFQEGDIELTERAEVPVVNKEARVVEEIRLSKDVSERDEIVRDTVRNTEVDVDRVNRKAPGRTDTDAGTPRNM